MGQRVTWTFFLLVGSLVLLGGCGDDSSAGVCGDGGEYAEAGSARFCGYPESIVIETGFDCPAELPIRIDLEGAVVCTDMGGEDDVPEELCRRVGRRCGEGPMDAGPPGADAGPASGDAGPACPTDIASAVDTACSSPGQFCGSELCGGGPCEFCNIIECRDGTWMAAEVFPAPCFSCGEERCVQDTQYCSRTVSGVMGGADSFACVDVPSDCTSMATCDCLSGVVEGDCDDSGDGVVITLFAP